jgi:predicted amidohydrolase
LAQGGLDGTGGIGVAVAQFAPGSDEASNLAAVRRLAETASSRGARIVVFPEYSSFFADPLGESFVHASQPLEGSFVSSLSALADELNLFVVAGLVETAPVGGKFQNTLVAVGPDVGLVATYRKQHLYDAFGSKESDWVAAGSLDDPETFIVDGVTVGMQTCYDIRFPEVTRRVVDAGAELVLVPSEWVRGPLKEHHWRTLLTARAIENTVYVAAADHVFPSGIALSMIVDPMGVAIAEAGEREGLAIGWIESDRVDQVRRTNPALELRRYRVVPD